MITLNKRCSNCGGSFIAPRSDATTCSPRCRSALYRKNAKAGKIPEIHKGRADLYRYFDGIGVLLYVGASKSTLQRMMAHGQADWYDDWRTMTRETFSTRAEADAAEDAAIKNEHPLYNKRRWGGPRRAA